MTGTRHVTQPGTEIMEISGRGEFIGGPNLADKDIVKHNPTSIKMYPITANVGSNVVTRPPQKSLTSDQSPSQMQ